MMTKMPIQKNEITDIERQILEFLNNADENLGFSSKEIAEELNLSWSVIRKYLKQLYDDGEVKRGKVRGKNKTYYYYT